MGPQEPPRMWTSQLGNWFQSHTENTPCPYTPAPSIIPSYSRCASIKSSEDPSWKRLQTSSRNPVSSGQFDGSGQFSKPSGPNFRALCMQNCWIAGMVSNNLITDDILWPSTLISNIELADMNRDCHHNIESCTDDVLPINVDENVFCCLQVRAAFWLKWYSTILTVNQQLPTN